MKAGQFRVFERIIDEASFKSLSTNRQDYLVLNIIQALKLNWDINHSRPSIKFGWLFRFYGISTFNAKSIFMKIVLFQTYGEKAWLQLRKNATSNIEQVLEVTLHKNAAVLPLTTYHENCLSKTNQTYEILLEK